MQHPGDDGPKVPPKYRPMLSDLCGRCSFSYKQHGNSGRCPHGATRYACFIPRVENTVGEELRLRTRY